MILIDSKIKKKYPTAFRAARKEKFRVVWLEQDLVYVARRKRGHGKYLVKLFAVQSIDGGVQIKMKCKGINGEPCNGYQWKGFCSHCAVVLLRAESKPNKKEHQEAA